MRDRYIDWDASSIDDLFSVKKPKRKKNQYGTVILTSLFILIAMFIVVLELSYVELSHEVRKQSTSIQNLIDSQNSTSGTQTKSERAEAES